MRKGSDDEIHECKKLVQQILTEVPATRNSDKHLIFETWKRQGILLSIGPGWTAGWFCTPEHLARMYNPESVIRVRAEIQNTQGLLLPTDAQVLIRRRIREAHIRGYYASGDRVLSEWQEMKFGIK